MRHGIFLVFCVVASSLHAHPLDMGLIQLDVREPRGNVSLDVNPAIAASLVGLAEGEVTVSAMQSRADALRDATVASGTFTRGGEPCRWGKAEVLVEAQKVTLTTAVECAAAAPSVRWTLPFVANEKLPPKFHLLVRALTADGERLIPAERGSDVVEISAGGGGNRGFGSFVMMGIEHIGAAPGEWRGPEGWHLPEGLDHILFVLALVLAGGGLVSLLVTATGFTIGHSITLALGALGWVHVPSRLVESLIALSIAVVAAEAFFQRVPKHRWKIATFFGLVHGLGFASAIAELQLSRGALVKALVGFNLGVEVGQAILIALFVPLLFAMRKAEPLQRYAVPACSVAVFVAGSYWFVQRALGL